MKLKCNNCNSNIIDLGQPIVDNEIKKCECGILLAVSTSYLTGGLQWGIPENRYDHNLKKVIVSKVHD